MSAAPRLAFTPGEPAGIGPDLAVGIAQRDHPAALLAIADPGLLQQRAAQLGLTLDIIAITDPADLRPQRAKSLQVLAQPLARPARAGLLDTANAEYVLATLNRATDLCLHGHCDALVTGPVNKAVINDAGIAFDGHTGYLAARSGGAAPVMMLACGNLRVALATVHIPLRAVPDALTRDGLTHTLRVLDADLRRHFGLSRPRILVAGLNPHAGESGYLGREELELINPVIAEQRALGLNLSEALPADTLFTQQHLADCDAVLAMYHDQGLPVIKHRGFGRTVNVSLGLDFIRTSVDHGTALDLAGSGRADTGSLAAAIDLAAQMARRARA